MTMATSSNPSRGKQTEERKEEPLYTESSGNVFLDLGFDPDEAANLYVRTVLMIQIEQHLKSRNLSQEEAAERLGISQPRVSYLMNRKIDKFSIDMLVNLAAKLDLRVDMQLADLHEEA